MDRRINGAVAEVVEDNAIFAPVGRNQVAVDGELEADVGGGVGDINRKDVHVAADAAAGQALIVWGVVVGHGLARHGGKCKAQESESFEVPRHCENLRLKVQRTEAETG